jgi:hypothetical protein
MSGDIVLMRDVEARYALRGKPLRYTVLAPYGEWLGRGNLRVLRVSEREEYLDLVLGYESYVGTSGTG